jgi:hypothetical protein
VETKVSQKLLREQTLLSLVRKEKARNAGSTEEKMRQEETTGP